MPKFTADEKHAVSVAYARELSPLRNTTESQSIDSLVDEQLRHFSIEPNSPYGQAMVRLSGHLYGANAAVHDLWAETLRTLDGLDRSDRVAYFNAKRFACFQLAKVLDNLQNPMRRTYQSVVGQGGSFACKGPYPIFDNVTAIFSANPVITRTATYLYACTEWVEDAFKGKEMLHEIYSRLLNPTSISLANHIVDLEAGPMAAEYMAWNFNSGMAAIDAIFAHLVGQRDIILSSRNVYGGTYQLLSDWYGKRSNLNVAVEWFDGFTADDFRAALSAVRGKYAGRLDDGRTIYVYLESPCNPHGYVLDVPAIARISHDHGLSVICDSTIGTPFLSPVLRREDPMERPDFVIHSYTKDLAGGGTTTAGVCIGRGENMFLPKGEAVTTTLPNGEPRTIAWDETLFWNVYYIKGAFLDADKAFEVINGMRTFELRIVEKCIGTIVFARVLAQHPDINVHCSAVEGDPNFDLRERLMHLSLPAPLFTIDMEGKDGERRVSRRAFKRLFDSLEPTFGLQVSLGQMNTVVLCPALTSHSELPESELREAGIALTTLRISVGNEDPRVLLAHLIRTCELTIEPDCPGFCNAFPSASEIDGIYRSVYMDVHERLVTSRHSMEYFLK